MELSENEISSQETFFFGAILLKSTPSLKSWAYSTTSGCFTGVFAGCFFASAGAEVFAVAFVFFAGAGFASVFGCSVLAGAGGGVTVFSTAGADFSWEGAAVGFCAAGASAFFTALFTGLERTI